MAFAFEGDLYIQDSSEPPRQLTDSGEDWHPAFTDDGTKLIFFRGLLPHDLYAIDVDGGQEQALVTSDLLLALGYRHSTELRSLAFVPSSHRLLFNTHELDPLDVQMNDQNRRGAKPNKDLIMVDADTGQVKPILPPGEGGDFQISPTGDLVALLAMGHVDVVNLDGEMIYSHLVEYTPTQPVALEPYLYWMPDAKGLIVLLPLEMDYDREGPATYAVWRYALDGSPAVRVPLRPSPTDAGPISVSPDRQWILYDHLVEGAGVSLGVGNLQDGHSWEYGAPGSAQSWSPDSVHFVVDVAGQGLYLGGVDASPTFLVDGHFLGWVDAGRYLYVETDSWTLFMGDIAGEIIPLSYDIPPAPLRNGRDFFAFAFS